jgi:hypothetical protein
VCFAGRTAHHGKILAGQMHQAAIDGCTPGHDPIRRQFLIGHSKVGCAMKGKQADLLEAAPVHQARDSLPRCEFTGRVLLLNPLFAATEFEVGALCAEVYDLFADGLLLLDLCLPGHPCS